MIPDSHCSTVNADKREDGTIIYKMETAQELERKRSQDSEQTVRRLRDFLEDEEQGTDMDSYLLPPKILLRYALLMDIVNPNCRRSVCFTKGQGLRMQINFHPLNTFQLVFEHCRVEIVCLFVSPLQIWALCRGNWVCSSVVYRHGAGEHL